VKQKGGILPIILLLIFAGATVAFATYFLKNKTAFTPHASSASETTFINKDLGVNVKLNANDRIKVTWPNLYKNDDNGGKSLTNIQIIIRNLTDNKILPHGRVKLTTKEALKTTSYIFDQTLLSPKLTFSVTLRATYGSAQTIYSDTSSYRYNKNSKNIVKLPVPSGNDTSIPKFGLAGWVEIDGSTSYKYSHYVDLFKESNAKLISFMVRWSDLQEKKGADIVFDKGWSSAGANDNDHWCNKNGIQCIILFGDAPKWATEKACANGISQACKESPNGAGMVPIDEEDFGDMARAIAATAKRFNNTAGIEILNEPDFAYDTYGGTDNLNSNVDAQGKGVPDYKDYANIVQQTWTEIDKEKKLGTIRRDYPILVGRFALDVAYDKSSSGNCDRFLVDSDGNNIPPSASISCVKYAPGCVPNPSDQLWQCDICRSQFNPNDDACKKRQLQGEFVPNFLSYSFLTWGRQFFDYLDVHYYESSRQHARFLTDLSGKTLDTYSPGALRGKTFWLRSLMDNYGAAGTPIIYSELGFPSGGSEKNSLKEQAEKVFILYAQGLSAGVESLSWYCFGDVSGDGSACDDDVVSANSPGTFSQRLLYGSGPGDTNLSRRPSFYAYKLMAEQLNLYDFETTDQTSGIEGYIFSPQKDSFTLKEVLWSRTRTSAREYVPVAKTFVTNQVTLYSLNGNADPISKTTIPDGGCDTANPAICDLDHKKNFAIQIPISGPTIAVWN
jgi:hypothetical protein